MLYNSEKIKNVQMYFRGFVYSYNLIRTLKQF